MKVAELIYFAAFVLFVAAPTRGDLVFVGGDSTTLQSGRYLDARSPHDIELSVRNARDTFWTIRHLATWLDDPDNDPVTAPPGPYDAIRLNNGIWDSQPLPITGAHITTADEFAENLIKIVGIARDHSPDALIIWGTTPRIDQNRLWIDPPPRTGLLDIDDYNAALVSYRQVAFDVLPPLGVVIDDGYGYYEDHLPADFGLSPAHPDTSVFWHFDGIHFDHAYRIHETDRMIAAIAAVLDDRRLVPEPSGFWLTAIGLGFIAVRWGRTGGRR